MNTSESLYELLEQGNVNGFSEAPQCIATVISRVYIFKKEQTVLKVYKRDNVWWNENMNDLSGGLTRSKFIRNDFEFNKILSPEIYRGLKTIKIEDGLIVLKDPEESDDELVIVMNTADVDATLTKVLANKILQSEEYELIGKEFGTKKLSLPQEFLPQLDENLYDHMTDRINDLEEWISSESLFSSDLKIQGLEQLRQNLNSQQYCFKNILAKDLSVCIDCNSENLLILDKHLTFIDAFPPKASWLPGPFNIDVFRTGADIYALAGEESFNAFLRGVESVAGEKLSLELQNFYLLYGALIMAPYLYMRSRENNEFLPLAEQYSNFIKDVLFND